MSSENFKKRIKKVKSDSYSRKDKQLKLKHINSYDDPYLDNELEEEYYYDEIKIKKIRTI